MCGTRGGKGNCKKELRGPTLTGKGWRAEDKSLGKLGVWWSERDSGGEGKKEKDFHSRRVL